MLHPVLSKTLGGLTRYYYFRQFTFSALLYLLTIKPIAEHGGLQGIFFASASLLLYPYSRFVYEGIINFIVGDNVFFGSALLLLITKICSMAMCWMLAILIAPLGLVFLYFYHSQHPA